MPDPLLADDGEREIQRTLDYLGRDAPMTLSAKPALPVAAPAVAGTGPQSTGGSTTPEGIGGAVGMHPDTGPAGEVPGGGGIPEALGFLTRGARGIDIARQLFGVGDPTTVGTSQILEDAPDTPFTAPTRGFTAPAPGFNPGGTGALESGGGTPGADQLVGGAEGGLSGLSTIANGIALAGPTLGMIPRWVSGQGGSPVNDLTGALLMNGAAFANPLTFFGTVGAGLLSGILEAAGIVGNENANYLPHREQAMLDAMSWAPIYADAIAMAQSPEEIAYLLGPNSRGGAPWWFGTDEGGPAWQFNYNPANRDNPVNIQGLILDPQTQQQINKVFGGFVNNQMDIINAAQAGNPQAQAFLGQTLAERQRRASQYGQEREAALAGARMTPDTGGGP